MSIRLRLSTRYGINTAILIVFFVGIITIIETLSYKHNWRKDFTTDKRHSLSEQTLNVLRTMDKDVKVITFVWKGSAEYEEVKRLFGLYDYESENFKVEYVDPDLKPGLAREYEVGRYQIPVAFFESENGRETITSIDEEQATNALIKVTRAEKKVVYFLTGHGERPLDETGDNGLSVAKKLLENKNYDSRTFLLMRAEDVPENCAVLIICGPQNDLAEPELEAIDRYLENGGSAFFLIDPEAAPAIKPFLERYGIVLGDDVIIDRLSRLFGGDELMPLATSFSNHAITRNFNITPFFPVARSVSTNDASGVTATWLIQSGERSWAETDLKALSEGEASFDEDEDIPGPVSLAAVSEIDLVSEDLEGGSAEPKMAAVVAVGDSDFATNARINLSGNSDLFMNIVNWLGKEESLIAIPPKESKFTPVVLTPTDARMLFVVPVIILPGLALIAAIYAYAWRSRRP